MRTPTDLAVLGEIDLEGLGIVLKSKRSHGKQNILAVDGLALFLLAFLGCYRRFISCGPCDSIKLKTLTLASDEGDELAHAFLHAFLGFLCNLRIFRQCQFHDACD